MNFTPITLTTRMQDGGSTALAVAGELDLATAALIEPELIRATAGGGRDVVLDLADLTFCDSAGAELFERMQQRCAVQGCRLSLRRVPRQPGRVLRFLGVDRSIPCTFA